MAGVAASIRRSVPTSLRKPRRQPDSLLPRLPKQPHILRERAAMLGGTGPFCHAYTTVTYRREGKIKGDLHRETGKEERRGKNPQYGILILAVLKHQMCKQHYSLSAKCSNKVTVPCEFTDTKKQTSHYFKVPEVS